jgi:uncharacterized membrane protein HdeD (DUF308 family)
MIVLLEILKITAWAYILWMAFKNRRAISNNVLWLTITSSILMIIAGACDIANHEALRAKSSWWLIANVFIIINYITVINRSVDFHYIMKKKLTDFVDQIKSDKKDLKNDKK